MNETVARLTKADRYREWVPHRVRIPARTAAFTDSATDYRLQQAFARQGIDEHLARQLLDLLLASER